MGGTKVCRVVDFLSVRNTSLSSNYNRNQVILKSMVCSNFMHKLPAKMHFNGILSINLIMHFTTNSTNISLICGIPYFEPAFHKINIHKQLLHKCERRRRSVCCPWDELSRNFFSMQQIF